MKNPLKILFLFAVVAFSACRSHKAIEASNYSANDSCVVQSDLGIHSITNIETTESIASCLTQDHIEFNDEAGEISIHSNGEVSIKGIKSVYLLRQDTHKQSATAITTNDSVTAKTQVKSEKVTTKANSINPIASSIWLKIFFFIALTFLSFLTIRYLKKLWLNSKN